MKNRYTFAYIGFLALLSIAINCFYVYELFSEFFKEGILQNYKEALISGIAPQLSWIVLVVWFVTKPIQRKAVLLITIIPMTIAHILHNYNLEPINFFTHLLGLLFLISLYLIGFLLLKRYEKSTLKS